MALSLEKLVLAASQAPLLDPDARAANASVVNLKRDLEHAYFELFEAERNHAPAEQVSTLQHQKDELLARYVAAAAGVASAANAQPAPEQESVHQAHHLALVLAVDTPPVQPKRRNGEVKYLLCEHPAWELPVTVKPPERAALEAEIIRSNPQIGPLVTTVRRYEARGPLGEYYIGVKFNSTLSLKHVRKALGLSKDVLSWTTDVSFVQDKVRHVLRWTWDLGVQSASVNDDDEGGGLRRSTGRGRKRGLAASEDARSPLLSSPMAPTPSGGLPDGLRLSTGPSTPGGPSRTDKLEEEDISGKAGAGRYTPEEDRALVLACAEHGYEVFDNAAQLAKYGLAHRAGGSGLKQRYQRLKRDKFVDRVMQELPPPVPTPAPVPLAMPLNASGTLGLTALPSAAVPPSPGAAPVIAAPPEDGRAPYPAAESK